MLSADVVYITEGEKAADAITVCGVCGASPSQGSKSPHLTDWSSLNGKTIVILPDRDDAGTGFVNRVLTLLKHHAPDSIVKVIHLWDEFAELEESGDAHDWSEHHDGQPVEWLKETLEGLPDHFDEYCPTAEESSTAEPNSDSNDGSKTSIRVQIDLNELVVNDDVISALAKRDDLYNFNGQLAVIVEQQETAETIRKIIRTLGLSALREIITDTCFFFEERETEEGIQTIEKRIPRWTYEAIIVRGTWKGIPSLRRIVNSPVLRPDGTVLQDEGFDVESGLFVDLAEDFPLVADTPTLEHVGNAVGALCEVVSDFPFKSDESLAAWVASLLTPLAREAYPGCTGPLFLFDANVRGSGKSLLGDINSLIVTGKDATRLTSPRDNDEARKRITALVLDNDQIVMIDNITGKFGSAALDAALTGVIWKDRRLGRTELVEAPLLMTWYASGNNVILAADTARRICHIRLESPLENPEDRDGFKHPNVRQYVRENRTKLLAAGLTILRGYIAAGSPSMKLKPWGSFEGWSDLVRCAVEVS